ncbi:MAG: dihydroorotate dehydrogenase electron transfer subunit [bacterium]|nr:dihydroorotate dehydrogenase electron transfer subunit [bacterium]
MAKSKFTVQIVENREVAKDTFLFKMHLLGQRIDPKPGQFLELVCSPATLLNRPFSIHYFYDDKKHIKILFRNIGNGTDFLSKKAVGDYTEFYGPFGKGFSINKKDKNIAIIAGGIGYAPMVFLIKELLKQKNLSNLDVFYGNKHKDDFVEFWRLNNNKLRFFLSTDNGSVGEKGFITDVFYKYLKKKEGSFDRIYTCGPVKMMKKISEISSDFKIPAEGSFESRFGCGFGVCLGCSFKLKTGDCVKVCKDGPVFDLEKIDWSQIIEE